MSRNIQLLVMMCVLTVPWHLANAQTTSPATGGVGLEQRATQLYNAGDYASALPLLQTLAAKFKDRPDQLSIVQEKIRFCQRKLAAANLNTRDKTTQPATAPATVPAAARQPLAAPKEGQVVELAIKDLGNFDYDMAKGGNIPDDVKRLNGGHVPHSRLHDSSGSGRFD